MNILATFNDNDTEPTEYIDRETVKAVILNDNDEVYLLNGSLPGGGVEDGETPEQALVRECMEEMGATVSIIKAIGTAVAYRDERKLRYVTTGYLCTLVSQTTPTTTQSDEVGMHSVWENRTDAIVRIENEIASIEAKGRDAFSVEDYQRKVFNRRIYSMFLKAIDN